MSAQFGRYQTSKRLAPHQFLADDPILERQVIIEVIPDTSHERFLWARQLARTGGWLVQRLHDIGKQGETGYLVREVVEGRSLEEIGPDPKWLPGLLQALEQIHRAGLEHGDLRPANAIVTSEGVLRLTNLCYQGRPDSEALEELRLWFAS